MGGYRITLPRNEDGSYNTDSIVQINGSVFEKWIDNPNTLNEVQVWETPFEYQVYIPQILIPPALDDDNFDGTKTTANAGNCCEKRFLFKSSSSTSPSPDIII